MTGLLILERVATCILFKGRLNSNYEDASVTCKTQFLLNRAGAHAETRCNSHQSERTMVRGSESEFADWLLEMLERQVGPLAEASGPKIVRATDERGILIGVNPRIGK